MNKSLAIIGAGGHGKVVGEIALLNRFKVIDFFDDKKKSIDEKFIFPIKGTTENLEKILDNYDNFFVAIGNNEERKKNIIISLS